MDETEGTLTFAKKAKNELAGAKIQTLGAKKAVLSGFTRLAGTLSIGSRPFLSYRTELSKAAKLIFSLLKELYGVTPRIVFERKMHFDKSMVYVVIADGHEVYGILEDLKVKRKLRPVPIKAMANKDNLRDFVKGLFLATGSLNAPESKSYFLEIAMDSQSDAQTVCNALCRSEGLFSFKVAKIRDKWLVYLKRSSEIAEFLAWLGAPVATLDYENARAEKDYFNNENRLNICYAANYSKSLKTGAENIRDINVFLKRTELGRLDAKTQAVIRSRLKNKDFSYGELAEDITRTGTKITKSGVARVFAKIKEAVGN